MKDNLVGRYVLFDYGWGKIRGQIIGVRKTLFATYYTVQSGLIREEKKLSQLTILG